MSAPARRVWPWLLAFAGLFLLIFHRYWFHTIIGYDAFNFFAPNKSILLRGLRQGTIYGWNPWLFLGMPFAAEVQVGVFYPLNLLFLLLDFGTAHRLYILVHYPLAAGGTFLLLRYWRLPTAAAVVGALAFALSGYLISQHSSVRMAMGAAWAPLAFYFASRALAEGFGWAVAAGAALALTVLAGDPETAAVTAAVAAGGLLVGGARSGRYGRGLGLAAVMAGAAFLFSAAQVLPTWEMMGQSTRTNGLPVREMVVYSLHPAQLLDFIWPTPFGLAWPFQYYWGSFTLDNANGNIPWSASNYLGGPVILAAAVGLAAGRRPWRWWLLAGAVLFLLLALGRHAPIYPLLSHVPVFNAFRYPSKYVAWLTLCLALAAALGAERLLRWHEEKPTAVGRAGMMYLAAVAVLSAAGWLGWPALMAALSPHPVGSPAWSMGEMHLGFGWSHWTIVNFLAGLIVLLAGLGRMPRREALIGLGFVIVADLYLGNVVIMPRGPADVFDAPPLAARAILAGGSTLGRGRVFRVDWDFRDTAPSSLLPRFARQSIWERQTLQRNHSAMSGIEDAALYGSYELRDGLPLFSQGMSPQVLALFNVRWLLMSPDARPVSTVPVETAHLDRRHHFRVDRMKNIWPRAFFVPGARRAEGEDEAIRLLSTVDLTREAVITGGNTVAQAPADAPGLAAARVAEYEPDRVVVELDAPAAGWLVLNDRFFPGWKATDNGAPVEIRRANVLVRAVAVRPGRHRVEFTYRPALLRWGCAVSGTAWVLALGWFTITGATRNRKKRFPPRES